LSRPYKAAALSIALKAGGLGKTAFVEVENSTFLDRFQATCRKNT
jgi:hypothetical protein